MFTIKFKDNGLNIKKRNVEGLSKRVFVSREAMLGVVEKKEAEAMIKKIDKTLI